MTNMRRTELGRLLEDRRRRIRQDVPTRTYLFPAGCPCISSAIIASIP
jgi:hypothetical protein